MLFKGDDNFNVTVNFTNVKVQVEKQNREYVDKEKFGMSDQKVSESKETVTINGDLKIFGNSNGRLIVEVKQALGGFIERIVNRLCARDEKVSENQNKK